MAGSGEGEVEKGGRDGPEGDAVSRLQRIIDSAAVLAGVGGIMLYLDSKLPGVGNRDSEMYYGGFALIGACAVWFVALRSSIKGKVIRVPWFRVTVITLVVVGSGACVWAHFYTLDNERALARTEKRGERQGPKDDGLSRLLDKAFPETAHQDDDLDNLIAERRHALSKPNPSQGPSTEPRWKRLSDPIPQHQPWEDDPIVEDDRSKTLERIIREEFSSPPHHAPPK